MTAPSQNGTHLIVREASRVVGPAISALIASAIMGLFWMWYTQGRLDERLAANQAGDEKQAAVVEAVRTQIGGIGADVAEIRGMLTAQAAADRERQRDPGGR